MANPDPFDFNSTDEAFAATYADLLVATKQNYDSAGNLAGPLDHALAVRYGLAERENLIDDFILGARSRLRTVDTEVSDLEGEVASLNNRVEVLESAPQSGVIHRDVTLVTVTSTIAETDILNYTIPAGTMSTNGELIRFRLWADHLNIGGTRNLRVRWYVDGSLVFDSGAALGYGANSTVWPLHIIAELVSLGASSQALYITQVRNNSGTGPTVGLGGMTANSIASASAGDVAAADRADPIQVRCTVEHAADIANIVTRRHAYTVALE